MQLRTPSAIAALSAISALALATTAHAQDAGVEIDTEGPGIDIDDTVFAGDFVSIGVGAALNPSYTGSDDYVISVLPIVQASVWGIDINPRAGGVTIDFLPDAETGPGFDLGIAARLRSNRASQVEDEVVLQYGELDRAIEVGPAAGVSFPQVLNPYDSLTISVDALFDVSGAHDGYTINPSVTYFTPLSRSIAASLSVGAEWADEDFQDYYFRVDPLAFTGTGASPLPAYEPDGGGFTSVGTNLLVAFDLDGDLTNGGLGLVLIGGYSRLLGDAKDNPFTSVRGSADQFLLAAGLGYTF